jgi:hypothetical protein
MFCCINGVVIMGKQYFRKRDSTFRATIRKMVEDDVQNLAESVLWPGLEEV